MSFKVSLCISGLPCQGLKRILLALKKQISPVPPRLSSSELCNPPSVLARAELTLSTCTDHVGWAQDPSSPDTEMCPLRNCCTKSMARRKQLPHGGKYRRGMEAGRAHGKGQGENEGRKMVVASQPECFTDITRHSQCHKDASPSKKAMSFMSSFVWSFILPFTKQWCLKTSWKCGKITAEWFMVVF